MSAFRFACVSALALAFATPALADEAIPAPVAEPAAATARVVDNAKAGAAPVEDASLFEQFHGLDGLKRISSDLVARSLADPRISDAFKGPDLVNLEDRLVEQFCYILGGPCGYTGKDMKEAHKDMGVNESEFGALVENLQKAMDKEGVPFRAQNKLLAKLAPMHRDVITR